MGAMFLRTTWASRDSCLTRAQRCPQTAETKDETQLLMLTVLQGRSLPARERPKSFRWPLRSSESLSDPVPPLPWLSLPSSWGLLRACPTPPRPLPPGQSRLGWDCHLRSQLKRHFVPEEGCWPEHHLSPSPTDFLVFMANSAIRNYVLFIGVLSISPDKTPPCFRPPTRVMSW